MELDFIKFRKEDFSEYLSWFQDPDMNKQLGPMEENDEWLDSVLNSQGECTYSIFQDDKLVAVIGIVYPDQENSAYGITHISVNPSLRSKGIGKEVLKKTLKLHPLKEGQSWIAYVAEKNPKAKLFFEKNGWKCESELLERNNMYLFTYKN